MPFAAGPSVGLTDIHGSSSELGKFVPDSGWSPTQPTSGLAPEAATAGPSLAAGAAPAGADIAAANRRPATSARPLLPIGMVPPALEMPPHRVSHRASNGQGSRVYWPAGWWAPNHPLLAAVATTAALAPATCADPVTGGTAA